MQDQKPTDANRKPAEATRASNCHACAGDVAKAEDANATEHEKHTDTRAAAGMGVRSLKPVSMSVVPAAEVLKKIRIATPPSTASTTKSECHGAWGCQFVTP